MSQRTVVVCDRCRVELELSEAAGLIRVIPPTMRVYTIDFCKPCYAALCDWLKLPPNHEARNT